MGTKNKIYIKSFCNCKDTLESAKAEQKRYSVIHEVYWNKEDKINFFLWEAVEEIDVKYYIFRDSHIVLANNEIDELNKKWEFVLEVRILD